MSNNKSGLMLYLCLFIMGVMLIPMISSCGKSDVSKTGASAQFQIVNLSPDLQAFNLYGHFSRVNANAYSYPVLSGYFLLPIVDTPFQIRPVPTSTSVSVDNILTLEESVKPNIKYTWFITGLLGDSSITSVFTTDTGKIPAIGRGKIRFINVSPKSPALSLTANDTLAFQKVAYKKVTDYIELTAGDYNFKVTATSAPKKVIRSFDATILDGKLYTIYGYGLITGADTAAFSTGVILNTIPDSQIK